MAILKPNIPLKYVKPDGTTQSEYPLTSIDQVIDEDGIHRLNQTIVRADLSDVGEGQVVLTNADLLDNHPASYFTPKSDFDIKIEELNTAIANSGKAIEGVNASIDQINTDVKSLQTDIEQVKFGDAVGKNLVDWSKASHTIHDYGSGNITNQSRYYGVLDYFETKGQKLTLSFDITSNVEGIWCAITLYDENKNYIRNVSDYVKELSVIPNSNEKYATFVLYSNNASLSKDDYYNVQLEYGDRTSYEPYVPSLKKLNSNIANISPLIAYPIGSVYFSVNNTNPSTILGGGTWVQIGSKLAVRENVFGNGKSLALTSDGSSVGALGYGANTIMYGSKTYGGNIGSTPSWGFSSGGDRNTGVPTKAQLGDTPQYSGLIVDTETIYSWKRTA